LYSLKNKTNIEKIYHNNRSIGLSCNSSLDYYKGDNFSIKLKGQEKQNITKDQLQDILNDVTKQLGFEKLKTEFIYEL